MFLGIEKVFLLLSLTRVVLCLKNVVLDIEPRIVQLGESATLKCSYELERDVLYCVKFYRGVHEFYRYTPKEHPSTKVFAFNGVHVDLKQSNERQVVLRDVGFNLSGQFTCEVTTDAPTFKTATVSKKMLVVVLPDNSLNLTTEKTFYNVGEVLVANCSSPPSRPAASLTFFLNNVVVCEKCVGRKYPAQDLWRSELSLVLPLFPSNFNNGRLTLKCVAHIGDLYEKNAEVNLYNIKDPVPARVTQSSAACSKLGGLREVLFLLLTTFTSLKTVSLFG